jgi:hypothetical protein
MNVISPEVSVAETASGNRRSVKRARPALRLRSRSQSAMKEAKSIWRSLASTGAASRKMHLDEFAELVGDAVLVALDDRGVRDRQSQWPAKQRHYRVPVGQSADRRCFRERRHEAEYRMHWEQRLRRHEHRQRTGQHQRGQRLDAPQFGGARGVAGSIERKCAAGGSHGGFQGGPRFALPGG